MSHSMAMVYKLGTVLLLLLLCAPTAHAAEKCIDEGAPGDACAKHSDCFDLMFCVQGKCGLIREELSIPCTVDADCGVDTYKCDPVSSTCKAVRGVGSECTSTPQCAPGATCTDGRCAGLALGAACDPTATVNPCVSPLYCSLNSVCATPKGDNVTCEAEAHAVYVDGTMSINNLYDVCAFPLICDGGAGERVCITGQTRLEGDACGPFRTSGCKLALNLVCSTPLFYDGAVTDAGVIPTGECFSTDVGAECSDKYTCARSQRCVCDETSSLGGRCVQTAGNFDNANALQLSWLFCIWRNPTCHNSDMYNPFYPLASYPGYCSSECEASYINFTCSFQPGFSEFYFPNYDCSDLDGGGSSSSSSGAGSGARAAAALVSMVLVVLSFALFP